MLPLYTFLSALVADRDEKGATATEYALIIAGIAVVIIGGLAVFGGSLSNFWSTLGTKLKL